MEINKALIKNCLAQKPIAQRELYDLLVPYLRAIANRYLRNESYSLDALQESFIKIFRSLEKYDSEKSPFKLWAARIVINTCINYNKRIIGQPTDEFKPELQDISINFTDFSIFTDEHLLAILKQMPDKYYEVFNLSIIDGYSHAEIAEILKISEVNSRKQLSRARKWLLDVFKDKSGFRSYLKAL